MKKVLSIIMLFVIIFIGVLFVPEYACANSETFGQEKLQSKNDNIYKKIHFYFGDDDEIDTTSFLSSQVEDISFFGENVMLLNSKTKFESIDEKMHEYFSKRPNDEKIKLTVEFESDFEKTEEYIEFNKNIASIKTIEDVRNLRKQLVYFSKEYHKNLNDTNIMKLDNLKYDTYEYIDYAPFIVIEMSQEEVVLNDLIQLAEDDSVVNISLASVIQNENEYADEATWIRTLKEIDAYSTVVSGLYTGEGVNVGILETGICDVTHENLEDKSIIVDPNCNQNSVTEHATAVTSIIALMAPDANLYVSNRTEIGLSWFIEQGCDVVNCSYGLVNTTKNNSIYEYDINKAVYRYDYDAIFDYQINAYRISVVKSAGNIVNDNTKKGYNPYGHITSPGLAYNAITVGGLEGNINLLKYELKYDNKTCYISTNGSAKPEISTLSTVTVPNAGTWQGSSVSAPQVTGVIALYMEEQPSVAMLPNSVKAKIIASAVETEDYSNIENSYIDEKVGAGCLYYYKGLRECEYSLFAYRGPDDSVPNDYTTYFKVNLNRNDELQVGLEWEIEVDIENNSCYITNYDIHVYDPNGNLVCYSSIGPNSNLEMVRYTAQTSGDYLVKVYQNGVMPEEISDYNILALVCNVV